MALKDLTVNAVRSAIQECREEGREAFLSRHGFRPSREYFLLHGGELYDSKAIAGVAHGYLSGRKILRSEDFSGGRNTVKPVLEALGFSVLSWEELTREQRNNIAEVRDLSSRTGHDNNSSPANEDRSWSDEELAACIEAYRLLWEAQLDGEPVVKARLARGVLAGALRTRSKSAYEYRMQNISAVLAEMQIAWVKGYPPAKNVGVNMIARLRSLIEAVWRHDDVAAKAATDIQESIRGGQGFMLSAAQKKAVELRAMIVAEAALRSKGYVVKDTSRNSPFDFLATKNGASIKVEVKGSTISEVSKIFMTRNEVDLHLAEKGNTALFVVSGIELSQDGDVWSGADGALRMYFGWDIENCFRQPLAFEVLLEGLPCDDRCSS